MCVGTAVPWLAPGVGALATQSLANLSFGPMALAMLREGVPAPRVVDALVATDAQANRRQVAAVDSRGQVGAWTGGGCIAQAGHHTGEGYSVQANMMTHSTVVAAMAAAYEQTPGDLAQRMIAALQAAQAEGGDIRGMQSAALKVVPGYASKPVWETLYDLRVDEHADPVVELARLVRLRHAQLLDETGYNALQQNRRDDALAAWAEARAAAPELEEMPFWQAVTLAERLEASIPLAPSCTVVTRQPARRSASARPSRSAPVCTTRMRRASGGTSAARAAAESSGRPAATTPGSAASGISRATGGRRLTSGMSARDMPVRTRGNRLASRPPRGGELGAELASTRSAARRAVHRVPAHERGASGSATRTKHAEPPV
jgi:uncharacterized Ntn-hydrolase superfamily protein